MNRKHIAISLLLALAANLTTAAAPDSERAASPDKPYNLHHLYRPDNLHTLSSAAPKPDNMDAPPVLQPQPASVYDAATAAKTDITYTPYPSAKNIPANNGHRKILGETADGRLVIQDYYQNSDRPRTAPYILNRYGDPRATIIINADSKLVWYNQDGSVYAIQHYHDGQPAGYLSYYRKGRLIAQKPRPGSDNDYYAIGGNATAGTRYYYDDGHILALEYQHGALAAATPPSTAKQAKASTPRTAPRSSPGRVTKAVTSSPATAGTASTTPRPDNRPRAARALTPPSPAGTTSNNICCTTTTSIGTTTTEPPPTCPSQPV